MGSDNIVWQTAYCETDLKIKKAFLAHKMKILFILRRVFYLLAFQIAKQKCCRHISTPKYISYYDCTHADIHYFIQFRFQSFARPEGNLWESSIAGKAFDGFQLHLL